MTSEPPDSGFAEDEYLELSKQLRRLARRLVRDEASAEDVVSQAWLQALDQPPERVRDLNAWLSQVVRNVARRERSREQRRRELEFLALTPREAEGQAPAEAVSRAAVARQLRQGIAELREPYRTVVSLRYLEELETSDIAARTGHSPATVRSQLHRGLNELKAILDRQHGGMRRAWFAPLVAALQLPSEEPRRKLGSGRLGPDFRALAGAASLLFIAALGWLFFVPSDPPGKDAVSTSPAPLPQAAQDSPTIAAAPTTSAVNERTPALVLATPPPIDPEATRVLELELPLEDGTPATDAMAFLQLAGDSRLVRGASPLRIELRPEELVGPPSIPGTAGGVKLMARPAGYAWSLVHNVELPPGGRRLTIASRGPELRVEGIVVDALGTPIENAFVVNRPAQRGMSHGDRIVIGSTPIEAYSDRNGRYVLEGLTQEKHRLVASAVGLVPERVTLGGSSQVVEHDFTLQFGQVVAGVIHDPSGVPVAGAQVWEPDYGSQDEHGLLPRTLALDDGSYELAGLEAGRHRLFFAHPQHPELFAAVVLEVGDDGVLYHDVRLAPTHGVHLQVLELDGSPIRSATAALSIDHVVPYWGALGTSDAEGRIHFPHVPGDQDLSLQVARSVMLYDVQRMEGLQRGPQVYTIRMGSQDAPLGAGFTGRLLDGAGRPLQQAFLHAASPSSMYQFTCHPKKGTFLERHLEAGTWELWVHQGARGTFSLGRHELVDGEVYDLGAQHAPPTGRVQLRWQTPPSPSQAWALRTRRSASARMPDQDVIHIDHPLEGFDLYAGSYQLVPAKFLRSPLSAAEQRSAHIFTVVAGQTLQLELEPTGQ